MRYLSIMCAILLLAAAGLVHGLRTDRWITPQDLGAAAARLDEVPMKVGDWEGQPVQLDPRQLVIAEAVGHLGRHYVNRQTGEEVTVVVLCGRPGPIAVHSPEVCYSGAGFSLTGDRATLAVPAAEDRPAAALFRGLFVKSGAVPEALDVAWAWTADGKWAAETTPRVTFARSSVLYKLYVIHRLARPDEKPPEDAFQNFLNAFLPALEKQLTPIS